MTGNLMRRLAAVAAAALLGTMLLGVGAVTASTPTWDISAVPLPPTVVVGNDAGYRVTVSNNGASNIVGLSFTTTVPTSAPTYVSSSLTYSAGGSGSCSSAGTAPLLCDLGTLAAHSTVTFTVAYKTFGTGSTFTVTFSIKSSSGDTTADGSKTKSHGDSLTKSFTTNLSSSGGNFDGGYFQGDTPLQTNQTIGRNNKQSTSLTGFHASLTDPFDVTISDGGTTLTTGLTCDTTTLTKDYCQGLLGEWSLLDLKEGTPQTAAFHVTMVLDGSYIPTGTSLSDLVLVHVYIGTDGLSHTDVIGDDPAEICASPTTPATAEPGCVYFSKVGGNVKVDAWIFHNGGLRAQ